ncbi:MAG: hypothetical protein AAGI72_15285 [Pseudomonadota bacterium]
MTDLVNALPCPHCGSTDLVKGSWYLDDPDASDLEGEVPAIECKGCGAGSPAHVWNQRQVHQAQNTSQGSSEVIMRKVQTAVGEWMLACFGPEISSDTNDRNFRFLEEALELVQSLGCTKEQALQLVDYVFAKPVGDPIQEVGSVRVTLAALCNANAINEDVAAGIELERIWSLKDEIRAKHDRKPIGSPLPGSSSPSGFEVGKPTGIDGRKIKGIYGQEPMRENEYPIAHAVGSDGVTEITYEERSFGTFSIGLFDVHKGDTVVSTVLLSTLSEIIYDAPSTGGDE